MAGKRGDLVGRRVYYKGDDSTPAGWGCVTKHERVRYRTHTAEYVSIQLDQGAMFRNLNILHAFGGSQSNFQWEDVSR